MARFTVNSLAKKSLAAFSFFTISYGSFSQDYTKSVKRSESLTETYSYMPNDKKVKDGISKVTDEQNKVLAMGYYRNNKKAGVWNYYSPNGTVVQQYDYANKKLLSNAIYDPGSFVRYSYELPGITVPAGANVEPPVKIGGNNYGFFLLYELRQIPKEIKNDNFLLNAAMSYEFTIDENGKLENWDIAYMDETSEKAVRREHQSLKGLPEDAYEFIAAKVDGKPVKSKVTFMIPLKVKENTSSRVGDTHTMMRTNN